LKLEYLSEGDGPLVVLLHGFPESRITWKRQLSALAHAGFHAVAPDLRGYGHSPKPKGVDAYRVTEVAGDVIELIESLSSQCVLVGHDWGAITAWTVAMMRPDLIRKLVIASVPHPAAIAREIKRSNKQKVRLLYQLFFRLPVLPELFMRLFGRKLLRVAGRFTPDEIDAYVKQWRNGSLTPMLNYYRALPRSRGALRKIFRKLDMPVLILWGEREPVFLASTIEDMGEWVSDVHIERFPRARHFVQCDEPDRVSQLLIDFASTPATAR
jgi:pimeloyl-ACP methyl ester carboxylesterase